ncbi:MAG: HlyD family efflux transporter periplasmic adaptor subunit [Polyangiaceae bacterium]
MAPPPSPPDDDESGHPADDDYDQSSRTIVAPAVVAPRGPGPGAFRPSGAPSAGGPPTAAAPPGAGPARAASVPPPGAAPGPGAMVPAGPAGAGLVRGHALFRRESLEAHLAAARDADILRVAPPWSRAVFWLVTSAVLTAAVLACIFDVEQTGFARGILRVSGGVQTVVAQANGVVLEVGPKSGDVVPEGALLVRIDSAQTRASILESERQIELANVQLNEFDKRRDHTHAERIRLLRQRVGLLGGRVAKQDETVRRLRAKQSAFDKLAKEGLASDLQRGDVGEEVTSAERETLRLREEQTATQIEIASLEASLSQERTQLVNALEQAKAKREALSVQLTQTEVRAPRAGRLEAIVVKVGDSLAVGAPVGKLVPTDAPRQVVVFVAERDRAFLAEGASGRIEVDQLPVGEFGTLNAKVSRIASDLASPSEFQEAMGDAKAQEPVFRVELALEPSENLKKVEQFLRPGSLVTARFALRKRRIITVLFEPLRRFFA